MTCEEILNCFSILGAIGFYHRDVLELQEVAGAALAGLQLKMLNRHFHHLLRRSIQHPAARTEWWIGTGIKRGCDGLRRCCGIECSSTNT